MNSPVDGSHYRQYNDRDCIIDKSLTIGDREQLFYACRKFMQEENAKLPPGLTKTEQDKRMRAIRARARLMFCNTMHLPDILCAAHVLGPDSVKQIRAVKAHHDPLHGKTNTIRRWYYLGKSLAAEYATVNGCRVPVAGSVTRARAAMTAAFKQSSAGANRAIDDMFGVDWEQQLRDRDATVAPWASYPVMASGEVLELAISLNAAGRTEMIDPAHRALRAFVTLCHAEVFPALLGCTAATG
ncbi:MAG: hypothetical protein ACPIOQ_84730, partial [Promethearchaeia archaeon]